MVMQEKNVNVQDDMGEGSMVCSDHPYKNSAAPGGICAICLQEKLGKLVSSSTPFPSAVFPSSSSSPSPSFRSHFSSTAPSSSSSAAPINPGDAHSRYHHQHSRRARIPFFMHKKKKKDVGLAGAPAPAHVVFSRSRSTVAGRRFQDVDEHSSRRRGFWSFLHPAKQSGDSSCSAAGTSAERARVPGGGVRGEEGFVVVVVDENESPEAAALDRKVSRSRSVGCGSRSFSGDFFERISTGFGDCTLRRVESHREGKSKATASSSASAAAHRRSVAADRVKCGGIFGGFMVNSSSSSSSSSSYWMSSSAEDSNINGKASAAAAGGPAHGRSKSWGWALASPMRAFSKPSSSTKREVSSNKNITPNLNAIPSLLAVGG